MHRDTHVVCTYTKLLVFRRGGGRDAAHSIDALAATIATTTHRVEYAFAREKTQATAPLSSQARRTACARDLEGRGRHGLGGGTPTQLESAL